MQNIGGCHSTWSKNTSICLGGVSLPELLSSLSNYCLTRRRALCTPTLTTTPAYSHPHPWLDSKAALSPAEAEITLLLTLTPSSSQLCLRCWSLWGRGSWGGGAACGGGRRCNTHPVSGGQFGPDLLYDAEQVVRPPWASVYLWRASASCVTEFSFSVNLAGRGQGVGTAQPRSWSRLRKNAFCSHLTTDQSSEQACCLTLFSHLQFSPS